MGIVAEQGNSLPLLQAKPSQAGGKDANVREQLGKGERHGRAMVLVNDGCLVRVLGMAADAADDVRDGGERREGWRGVGGGGVGGGAGGVDLRGVDGCVGGGDGGAEGGAGGC